MDLFYLLYKRQICLIAMEKVSEGRGWRWGDQGWGKAGVVRGGTGEECSRGIETKLTGLGHLVVERRFQV